MKKKLSFAILSFLTILIGFTSCNSHDDVAVTSIQLDKTTITLLKGENTKLTATVLPENASNPTVSWNSSNSSIATVDTKGNITAVAAGTTVITVTSADGQFSASCSVNVNVNVSSITLSDTSITLEKGSSKQLSITINPVDATDKSVTWFSSDTNIATVDKTGNVTAVNGGNATITAKSADGKITATCSINVTVSVQSVFLNKNEITLIKGQTATLNATITPSDVTIKDVTWSTSDKNIVTVESGNIKAVSVGTATITVTTTDGNKTASCSVKVDKSENIGYNPYGEGQKW